MMPLLAVSAICIVINCYNPTLLNSITAEIRHHPINYLLFRWGLLCIFIMGWPHFIRIIGNRRHATPDQILQWRIETWRIATWLILIELLVCENILGKLIHLLGGTP
jgi:hypothetical protein